MNLVHITVGGGDCVRLTVAILTRSQVGRVPVLPVVFGVRGLVFAMLLFSLM